MFVCQYLCTSLDSHKRQTPWAAAVKYLSTTVIACLTRHLIYTNLWIEARLSLYSTSRPVLLRRQPCLWFTTFFLLTLISFIGTFHHTRCRDVGSELSLPWATGGFLGGEDCDSEFLWRGPSISPSPTIVNRVERLTLRFRIMSWATTAPRSAMYVRVFSFALLPFGSDSSLSD